MGFDPDSGRHVIGKSYCIYQTYVGNTGSTMFHLGRPNGETYAGSTIDALAKDCAIRFRNRDLPAPDAGSVGTINAAVSRIMATVDSPVKQADIEQFIKAYAAYADKFAKSDGVIDCIRRAW